MCQYTQLEKVEPQEIFVVKECRILQALITNITATDENKNEINTFFYHIIHKNCSKYKKIKKNFFSVFIIQFSMTSVKSVT